MPSPAKTQIGTDAAASRDDTFGARRRPAAQDALTRQQLCRQARRVGRCSGRPVDSLKSAESPRLQAG
jgi:hypothetical protein